VKALIFLFSVLLLTAQLFAQTPVSQVFQPTTQISKTGLYSYKNSLTLLGKVNPGGNDCEVYFEWGTTKDYGNTVAASPASITGSINTLDHSVSANILVDLIPVIHYRLKIVTATTTFYSRDLAYCPSTYNPTCMIEIFGACAQAVTQANYEVVNYSNFPVQISFASGESFSGVLELEPKVSYQIYVYPYSMTTFTYKNFIFKQLPTNNILCSEPQQLPEKIEAYALGNAGGVRLYSIKNKNNSPVTLTGICGEEPTTFTIPANDSVYVAGDYDLALYLNEDLVVATGLYDQTVGIKESAFLSTAPISMNPTTATFEIQNNDSISHDAILRDASGNEHRYTLAAYDFRNVTVENRNWDVYLAMAGTIDISSQMFGDHIKVGSVSPANAHLSVSEKTVEIDANPLPQTITVSSDRTWTVSSDQAWLTLNKASGAGNEAFILSASGNTSGITRTATITITAGCEVETVSVTQLFEPGNALNFDGINDHVAITDNDASISTAFTIAGWVLWQPNSTTDIGFISGKGVEQLEIHTGGGAGANGLRFIPTNGVYLDAPTVLPVGQWTHVACSYDATNSIAKMYINGNEVTLVNHGANPVGTALQSTATSFYLGSRSNATYLFKGSLDEFSIWNRVLSQSEIQQNRLTPLNPAFQTGLVCYYNFNAGTAGGNNTGLTTLTDRTGNFNGTLTNFVLSGATSNWVESYAMVVPTAVASSSLSETGFSANWTAASVGTVGNYLLEVATDAAFTNLVSGYNPKTIAAGTITETISGLTPNTSYYYRVRADKLSVTGQGTYSNTITAQTTINYTWSGTGTWDQTANWSPSSLPTNNADVTVSNGTLTINQDVTISSLVVNSGAAITIASGKSLTINGNLSLKSNTSGTSSLINNGVLTVTGITTTERYMTAHGWHMISSPVTGQSIVSFLSTNSLIDVKPSSDIRAMMNFDETTDRWSEFFTNSTPGNLSSGYGFAVWPITDGTVNYRGTLKTGTVNVIVTRTPSTGYGWNLVGNPYSSAIKLTGTEGSIDNFYEVNFDKIDNIYSAIYIWDNSESTPAYTLVNRATSTYYAALAQGFFVKAKSSATGSFQFTQAMQVHQNTVQLKSAKTNDSEINLLISNNNLKAKTSIKLIEGMSRGLDVGYDAGILKAEPRLSIFTRLVDDVDAEFMLQCLSDRDYHRLKIPVGFDCSAGESITISAEAFNLPEDLRLILEDEVQQKFVDLAKGAYTTTTNANTVASNRFVLHTSEMTTRISEDAFSNHIKAYIDRNKQLQIIGETGKQAFASIYDVQGRLVLHQKLQSVSEQSIPLYHITGGIFMLIIKDESGQKTFKLKI
jgi:hypothetical protein